MPLVKIDIVKGTRQPAEVRLLADTVQEVMLSTFGAPSRDRYQIITQHEPDEIICEDSNLGYQRSDKIVIIQIFQQGRSFEQKKAVYAELAQRLGQQCGLAGGDLIVSCVRNEKEDWSLGLGRAQFFTGDL